MNDYLIFDEPTQRYVLTKTAVEEMAGVDLSAWLNTFGDVNPASVPLRFLKRVSMLIYNFIEKRTANDRGQINYLIKLSPRVREGFIEALVNQTMYMLDTGDLGLQSGVNLKDGRAMRPDELRGIVRISPDAEDILLNAGLLYCGIERSWL